MKKHRVLVIEDDSLFNNSIKLQLVLQESLEIVSINSVDAQVINAEIKNNQPRAVIFNDKIAAENDQLILGLLKNHPNLQVITFSLEDNRINVYDNQEFTVTTTKDLVTAIIRK